MHNLFISLFLLFTFSIAENSNANTIAAFDFKKLNYHEKQRVVVTLQKFMLDLNQSEQFESYSNFYQLLKLNSAYASENFGCFFGGWPSEEINGICKTPWTHGEKDAYTSCQSSSQFRCNPILFGPGEDSQGLCIETNGSYANLTNDCLEKTNDTNQIDQVLQNILGSSKNLNKLQNLVQSINQFCHRQNARSKGSHFACDKLEKRMQAIKDRANEIRAEDAKRIKERNLAQQNALSIMNTCQSHYEKENEGFWASMVKSDRNIIGGIKDNFVQCNPLNGEVTVQEFDNLQNSIESIEEEVVPEDILEKTNQFAVQNTIQTLLMTKVQHGESFSEKSILKDIGKEHPDLLKDPNLKDIIKKNVDKFNDPNITKHIAQKSPSKIANELNEFGKKMNAICDEIRNEHKAIAGGWYRLDVNNEAEDELYNRKQDEMDTLLAEFRQENSYANLLNTESIRDDFFPYNADLAEDCAENETGVDKVFNTHLKANDIQTANRELQDLLMQDFDSVNDNVKAIKEKDKDDIKDGIKDVLKYKPFLMGELLKTSPNELQETYAKYFCKQSLDIYDSDELWAIGEVTLGAVAITGAIAVNVIPGLGQIASGAIMSTVLTATGVGVAGFELTAAGRRYLDGENNEDSTLAGISTGQISSSRAAQELLRSTDAKSWALFDTAMATVGLSSAARIAKTAQKTRAINNIKTGDEILLLTSEGKVTTAVVEEVTQTKLAKKPEVKLVIDGEKKVLKESDLRRQTVTAGDTVSFTSKGDNIPAKVVDTKDGYAEIEFKSFDGKTSRKTVKAEKLNRPSVKPDDDIQVPASFNFTIPKMTWNKITKVTDKLTLNKGSKAEKIDKKSKAVFEEFVSVPPIMNNTQKMESFETAGVNDIDDKIKLLRVLYTYGDDITQVKEKLRKMGMKNEQISLLENSGSLRMDPLELEKLRTVPPMNRADAIKGAKTSYPNENGFLEHAEIISEHGDGVIISTIRNGKPIKLRVDKSELSQPIIGSKSILPEGKDGLVDLSFNSQAQVVPPKISNYSDAKESVAKFKLKPRAQYKTSGKDYSEAIDEVKARKYQYEHANLHVLFDEMRKSHGPEHISNEFKTANEKFLKNIQEDLRKQGVSSVIRPGGRDLATLEITGANPNANRVARMYLRVSDRLNSQSMTVSPFDNFVLGSNAFNNLDGSRLEMGSNVAIDLLQKKKNSTFAHEARHQMFNSRRTAGRVSIFDNEFIAVGKKGLHGRSINDQRPYHNYMTLEELYNHSSDVWNDAKKFNPKDPDAEILASMKFRLEMIKELSRNTGLQMKTIYNELDDIFADPKKLSIGDNNEFVLRTSDDIKYRMKVTGEHLKQIENFNKLGDIETIEEFPAELIETYLKSDRFLNLNNSQKEYLLYLTQEMRKGEKVSQGVTPNSPKANALEFFKTGVMSHQSDELVKGMKKLAQKQVREIWNAAGMIHYKANEVLTFKEGNSQMSEAKSAFSLCVEEENSEVCERIYKMAKELGLHVRSYNRASDI